MLKSVTCVVDSWKKPNFTLVKIVVLNSPQLRLDCIVKYVNPILIKQVNSLNSKFISCKFLNLFMDKRDAAFLIGILGGTGTAVGIVVLLANGFIKNPFI